MTLPTAVLTLGGLAACSGTPGSERATEPVTRAQAEARTGALQHRIVEAFPAGSVTEENARRWVLLSCSQDQVQTAGGVHVTLAGSVDVDETYDAIVHAVEPDGYSGARDTTPKGAARLTVTGPDDDQYLVTIYREDGDARISSFSPCFPGSLADG
ncbi:hypothetical protein NS184_08350 [Curtobacterium luteum]|uniref:Uncharacterized protein n=1 Tax=Curtobacterium luteum TaxID=33881 RepID=A0A175RVY9_9MICO|nr:hypothetical protein NS184_08350 [Curtobacterium luteum]